MDVDDIEALAARYVWQKRRDADKEAGRADYTDGTPIETANNMRQNAAKDEAVLSRFIAWLRSPQRGK